MRRALKPIIRDYNNQVEDERPTPVHDAFASDYDRQALEYHCFIPEILFGLCYEYLRPGERLLDVGIGTGLSAAPFAKAGLVISGIDVSQKMLNICQDKAIAADLKLFDVSTGPWPYPEAAFDHVVCCGVLHFFEDLGLVFSEAGRVMRAEGVFGFTTKVAPAGIAGVYLEVIGGTPIFSHEPKRLDQLIVDNGFETLKMTRGLVGNERDQPDGLFRAYVTRKQK